MPIYIYGCNSNDHKREAFHDLANILYKMFTILATLVALKFTDPGHYHQHTATECVLAAIILYFLLWLLHTLLQHPINTVAAFFPISLLLLLGCIVSFLTLTLISFNNIAIITLALWIIVFIVVVMFNFYHQLCQLSRRTRELIQNYMPQLRVNSERMRTWIENNILL